MSSLLDPNSSSSTKRKLESEFDDDNTSSANHSRNNQDSSLSKMSKLEHHLLEGEMKASLVKLITLEQQLAAEKFERQKLENEFTSYKEKQASDIRLLEEQKKHIEQSLKNSKVNEKLINEEMEHLRKTKDEFEKVSIPEKDKEIERLKLEIKNLKDEAKTDKSDLEAENTKLKFDLESKTSEISRLNEDINSLNEMVKSNKEMVSKLNELRTENSLLKNELRDSASELEKLRDEDGSNLKKFMDQSSRISDLERENRSLKTEVDYLRAIKEKSHLFQEELESKKKQIERYDKKVIDLELEKLALQDEIKVLKEAVESQNSSNSQEELKKAMSELKSELSKSKEKLKESVEERKKLKSELNSKEDEVNELQRRLTRTTTERNGYKRIIEMSEETKYAPDGETKLLRKRVEELEIILSTYKKMLKESDEIKLGENSSFRFENIDVKCAEIQVNLNVEIYSEYEKKIQQLKDELEEKKSKSALSNETSQDEEKENSKVLETKLNEQIRFNQQIKTEYMRRAKDIAKKLNTLLGFHVSFDDDDIKFQDKNNSENFLIFQSKPNGSISLKESDYFKTYSYLINSHLRPFKSYLVFLAAVYCDSNGLKLDVTEKSFI